MTQLLPLGTVAIVICRFIFSWGMTDGMAGMLTILNWICGLLAIACLALSLLYLPSESGIAAFTLGMVGVFATVSIENSRVVRVEWVKWFGGPDH